MTDAFVNTLQIQVQSANEVMEDIQSTTQNGCALAQAAMEQAKRAAEEARVQARRAAEQQREAEQMAQKAKAEAAAAAARARTLQAARAAEARAAQSMQRALAAAAAAQKRAAEAKAGHEKALQALDKADDKAAAGAQVAQAQKAAAEAVRAAHAAQQMAQEVLAKQNGVQVQQQQQQQSSTQTLPTTVDPNTVPSHHVAPLEVEVDTTLEQIATHQGTSLTALRRLNPQLQQNEELLAGQSVLVPTFASVSGAFGSCAPDTCCEPEASCPPDTCCEPETSCPPDTCCDPNPAATATTNTPSSQPSSQPHGSSGNFDQQWSTTTESNGSEQPWSHPSTTNPSKPNLVINPDPNAPVGPVTGPAAVGGLPPQVESVTAHRTDFLTIRGPNGEEIRTHTYAGQPPEVRAMMRAQLKAAGYTDMYVYVANDQDYGGPSFNFYDQPEAYAAILKELVDDGIRPVPWMIPDDNPHLLDQYPPGKMAESWSKLIPAIDPYVSTYCLGLELDEYFPHGVEQTLGNHLNTLTEKPIFVHYTPGVSRSLGEPWVDGIIYQYGFGKSAAAIEAETRRMVARCNELGKIFIAGEYSLDSQSSRALGAAAMRGGAHGFGNGGIAVSGQPEQIDEPNGV